MGLLDLLRFNAAKPPPPDKPEEHIFAVPLAAVKRTESGENPRETYIFYAFLFAKSAPVAVERLRRVDKTGGNSGAVEGGRDFLGDVGGLAHAAEDQLSARRRDRFDGPGCFDEFCSQAFRCRGERGGLDA